MDTIGQHKHSLNPQFVFDSLIAKSPASIQEPSALCQEHNSNQWHNLFELFNRESLKFNIATRKKNKKIIEIL